MQTVLSATFDVLRTNDLTTIFGNPGSNELPFIGQLPPDFNYVLGLNEGVVVGIADGFAQASNAPALVNLHSAAGTGNAMGALTNAWYAHSPLVVTAGQQVRAHLGGEAMLSNVQATLLPQPLVKLALEPALPADVPRSMAQAVHTAMGPPRGPVYLSIPYDDWNQQLDADAPSIADRQVRHGGRLAAEDLDQIVARLRAATRPALVLGGDVDATEANELAVTLADRASVPTWIAPSPYRCPFPTRHPCFQGVLPTSMRGLADVLAGHDLILVIGAPVFRYHHYQPGPILPDGTSLIQLTSDPGEAARAWAGDAYVCDIPSALAGLIERIPETGAASVPRRTSGPRQDEDNWPVAPARVFDTLNSVVPDSTIYVTESTSTTDAFWDTIDLADQGSYYFAAAGGLGFGMPGALGVKLASPDRKVVALIGDGAANFSIPALWTAARYGIDVTYLILQNETYGALRPFAASMGITAVPGLDISGIDFCSIAAGYGVPAERAGSGRELAGVLKQAMDSPGPRVIVIPTSLD
ncbi:benzoylformate decarboxylase [Kribbella solani]|uniref:benzoylformate decarboxylase n=1 Tax=Kribbella solani TaxID=236067 RepID=UPI0029B2B48E|nr:benzoylformate decarboxylase [Kribbella solani]MDX3001843.1 benzoylformate decarboxylase [Kribbella solani]